MSIHSKLSAWDNRNPYLFVVLRVILGMILAFRGLYYLTGIQPLYRLIEGSSLRVLNVNMPLALFICWVHILGGTFIILGFLTRISVWAQIPVILGAIFFINLDNSLAVTTAELILSIFVLLLLVVFSLTGGGKISMDNYLKKFLL